jgi:hypothetical protein
MANSLASPTLTNLLSELFAAADGDDEHAPPVPSGLSSWAQAPAAEQADAFQDCYIPISAEGGGGPQRGGDDPPGRCLRERGLPGGGRHRDQLLDRALAAAGAAAGAAMEGITWPTSPSMNESSTGSPVSSTRW